MLEILTAAQIFIGILGGPDEGLYLDLIFCM